MIRLMLLEARARRNEVTEPVETVFIGGGTPSLLPPALFTGLVRGLRDCFPLDQVEEWTCEANPGTVTEEWLDAASAAGVNRLSLGVQAWQLALLQMLGRIHTPEEASQAVRMARKHGFRNLNLDLIFGLPGQSVTQWKETLDAAIALSPEHISAYGLIPEEGTPLYSDLEAGRLVLPDPDVERAMYDLALSRLDEAGFRQYEISNFARDGFACRHNIGYWTQKPYLGLGVASASMQVLRSGKSGMFCRRKTSTESPETYRQAVLEGKTEEGWETVGPAEARFETLMLGLRMNEGVSEAAFQALHGVPMEDCYGPKMHELEEKGLLRHDGGRWRLTRRGMDIQNSVLVELMD